MNIKRILFPTDYSPASSGALEYASTLANAFGAVLHIAHVDDVDLLPIHEVEGYANTTTFERATRAEMLTRLHKVKPSVFDVPFEHHLLQGDVATQILSLVASEHIDLIVMSSHGRTGLSRLFMGSVAEHVLRHSQCPVVIIKGSVSTQPSPATTEANSPVARL